MWFFHFLKLKTCLSRCFFLRKFLAVGVGAPVVANVLLLLGGVCDFPVACAAVVDNGADVLYVVA